MCSYLDSALSAIQLIHFIRISLLFFQLSFFFSGDNNLSLQPFWQPPRKIYRSTKTGGEVEASG